MNKRHKLTTTKKIISTKNQEYIDLKNLRLCRGCDLVKKSKYIEVSFIKNEISRDYKTYNVVMALKSLCIDRITRMGLAPGGIEVSSGAREQGEECEFINYGYFSNVISVKVFYDDPISTHKKTPPKQKVKTL